MGNIQKKTFTVKRNQGSIAEKIFKRIYPHGGAR